LPRTRWSAFGRGSWDYGTDPAYLRELCDYWQGAVDWRAQEQRLNTFQHFRVEVDGLGIRRTSSRRRASGWNAARDVSSTASSRLMPA
jgi:hypothetical protein